MERRFPGMLMSGFVLNVSCRSSADWVKDSRNSCQFVSAKPYLLKSLANCLESSAKEQSRTIAKSSFARSRVINVDKNRAYPAAVEALKEKGILPGGVQLRQCKYLNNVVEQDHRTVKKRTWLAKGYGSFVTWRTLQGIEAMNMIRKGRARWVAKGERPSSRTANSPIRLSLSSGL